MSSNLAHVRHGSGSVRPYLHGPVGLPAFLQEVFGAVEVERYDFGPESFHVEMKLSDSFLIVEAGDLPPDIPPWKGTNYVYVADVDDTYAKAIKAGATSLAEPEDKHYQERQCAFLDAAGNTWWVATYKA